MRKSFIRKLTLTFEDRAAEARYRGYDVESQLGPVRTMLVFILIAGPLESFYRIAFEEHGLSLYRASIFGFFVVVGAGLRMTYLPAFRRVADRVALVIMPLALGMTALQIANGAPEERAYLHGLYFLLLLANVVLPFSHLLKHAFGAMIYATFLAVQVGYDPKIKGIVATHLAFGVIVASILSYMLERLRRQQFLLQCKLEVEHARSEALLLNTLPEAIATRLKRRSGDEVVVDRFEEAVVVFADVVGFTAMAARLQPEEVVRFLDHLFSRLDAVTAQHGLEKIKTIGDAYMLVAGVPTAHPDALAAATEAALDIVASVRRFALLSGQDVQIRVGLHVGPVVAGVIGRQKFLYDLWGDTVNIAARLESTAEPGRVHVAASTAARLHDRFKVVPRGVIGLKGIGNVTTCYLEPLPLPVLKAS